MVTTNSSQRLLGVVLAAAFFGCSGGRPAALYGPMSSQALSSSDYSDVLETWTRTTKIYRGLENKLFLTATYHAPEFRRAFAVAFPDIYGHGGEITKRELVHLTENVEQYHTFFVTAYTPKREWNEFSESDSIWRLTLVGANEVAVSAHEVLAVKVDENLRAVYPFISRFDKAYLVRFPLADKLGRVAIDDMSNGFTLRVASALGVAELKWSLIPTPKQQKLTHGVADTDPTLFFSRIVAIPAQNPIVGSHKLAE